MPTCLTDNLAPDPSQHPGAHSAARPLPWPVKLLNLVAVGTPFVGFIAAMIFLWGWGFSWLYLAILCGMVFPTALSVTIGYHRLFTHRSFETIGPIKFILGVLGSMALEGPIIKWCSTHRHHHQHSDHE